MIFFNIINLPEDLKLNHNYEFSTNGLSHKKLSGHPNSTKVSDNIYKYISENNNKLKIVINKFIGQGAYGKVFLVTINGVKYAMKISSNELPDKLYDRYNSLIENENLAKNIVEIFSCGNITTIHNKTKYFSIMEYGGVNIKKIKTINNEKALMILKQIYNIVEESRKSRQLITDFKANNIIVNTETMAIKLIDLYMFCESYPCTKCKIVKTYPSIEFDNNNKIYENKEYNFAAIYVPLAITLIDLLCKNDYGTIAKGIIRRNSLEIDAKQLVILLQVAAYNFNNNFSNKYLKGLKHTYPFMYPSLLKYKKDIENKFPILKNNNFYIEFINNLDLKISIFSKKKFIIIINSLITMCPYQRCIKYFKKKIFNE